MDEPLRTGQSVGGPTADQGRAARRRRRALWLVAATGTAWAFLSAAGALLAVPERIEPADVIVVLGGDGPPRAARAAELALQGVASKVLVTGDGDCLDIKRAIVAAGVPAARVLVECRSRNTFENAGFSAPILQSLQVRRGVLVTSWFHVRRALGCFTLAAPAITWMAAPAPAIPPVILGPSSALMFAVPIVKEYLKLGWYAVRYGIAVSDPFTAAASATRPDSRA